MLTPSSMLAALPSRTTPLAAKRLRAATLNAYARDLQKFAAYGFAIPCSADTLLAFLRVQIKRVAPATALRRVMAVQHEHRRLGHASPTADTRVREALRTLAAGQVPQLDPKTSKRAAKLQPAPEPKKPAKSGISRADLLRIFDAMGTQRRAMDLRDKAALLLCRHLKRSVALGLAIEHLRFTDDALLLTLYGEPLDATEGPQPLPPSRTLALPRTRGPLCPVTAVEAWLTHLDRLDQTGPVFVRFDRGGDPLMDGTGLDAAYLNCILKVRARAAGFTEAEIAGFSAEALRRGAAMERLP